MNASDRIFLGQGENPVEALLAKMNRHGLITGATGTGKTVTLQVLAEGLSDAGVPVFMADVKGDLSGLCQPGEPKPKLMERAAQIGLSDYTFKDFPVIFWDVFGEQGDPVRGTVLDMGPLLLSRMLNLNDVQQGVLHLTFRAADDNGLLILDLKDIRAMLQYVSDNAKEFSVHYGNVSGSSVGAIQRSLLVLEEQGANSFFGEPALALIDLMRTNSEGRGYINILSADKLMQSPSLYATFLLWLLSELFEELPEVGDLDRPKLVFFFDEAHLLFNGAPKALINKVESVVRLIRSKGVGVFFITQNPMDVPETVLGQLGNRVQHALRAFTPLDQKAVKAAAQTFRANPKIDTETAITNLGVGEALVSVLDEKGAPTIVQKTMIRPPSARLGPADESVRNIAMTSSPVAGRYDKITDRESAYERLKTRTEQQMQREQLEASARETEKECARPAVRRSTRMTPTEAMLQSAVRSIGSQVGRQIVRGILGTILKSR